MSYLTEVQLQDLGFRSLGRNVRISDKASIYNADQIDIGDNSRIDDFCVISGCVTIGSHVHIAPFCLIAGGTEGVILEDFAGLAYGSQVFSQSDDYSGASLTNPTVNEKYKNVFRAKVKLGRHVIVGAGSIIFPGVTLEEGCSVGALSLVHKSTTPWGIYVGNPARRIKDRKQDLLALETAFLKEKNCDSI
ncbi:acyltransferase [Brachymonas denitrificans]|uniref:acyltransferase n=1 Tax=Brachymonas denitrificans TaxID=28220 RepID=UPI0032204E9C